METSMKAEHSKEITSLTLDLQSRSCFYSCLSPNLSHLLTVRSRPAPAHREDLGRAKHDAAAQDSELHALRDQINAVTADLNVARSAPASTSADSAAEQLPRTIANLREELESHQESANLTKASLVQQIEMLSENRNKESEEASVARVREVEAVKRAADEAMAASLAEVEALRQQLEDERELKNKGPFPRNPLSSGSLADQPGRRCSSGAGRRAPYATQQPAQRHRLAQLADDQDARGSHPQVSAS
jgi:hypothetical protein